MSYCTVKKVDGGFDLVTEDQTLEQANATAEREYDETSVELQVWTDEEYLAYLKWRKYLPGNGIDTINFGPIQD